MKGVRARAMKRASFYRGVVLAYARSRACMASRRKQLCERNHSRVGLKRTYAPVCISPTRCDLREANLMPACATGCVSGHFARRKRKKTIKVFENWRKYVPLCLRM